MGQWLENYNEVLILDITKSGIALHLPFTLTRLWGADA